MMRTRRVLFRAIAVITVTIMAPGIATGQQSPTQTLVRGPGEATILLQVPLDISGYSPNVTRVEVSCSAQFVGDKNRQGASMGASIPMSQGAFHANAQFSLNLTLMKPGEQWSYQCQLVRFYNAALNVWSLSEVWARPQAGGKSNTVVTGTFIVQ